MKILVLNAGSSSLKYALFKFPSGKCLLNGLIDKIGCDDAHYSYQIADGNTEHQSRAIANHNKAFDCMLMTLARVKIAPTELTPLPIASCMAVSYFKSLL